MAYINDLYEILITQQKPRLEGTWHKYYRLIVLDIQEIRKSLETNTVDITDNIHFQNCVNFKNSKSL